MAKKAASKNNELDTQEFFSAIEQIEKERGIPQQYMFDKIGQALISAYKRDHPGAGDNVVVECDPEACEVRMYVKKDVVEVVDNASTEISLEEAREKLPQVELGDVIRIELKPRNFGRIAAQTARQVIIQGMREAERSKVYDEFSGKSHEIMTGTVVRIAPATGAITLRITSGKEATEAYLTPSEQVKGEVVHEGDRLKVYMVEVRHSVKGAQIMISRTHPGLVKRLFELEVPEIHEGIVEVKSISREAGNRTKIAVWSKDENVDPVGACVGPHGQRVNGIVEELRGEKIDIVKYSDDPADFVAAALAPATVQQATIVPGEKTCRVIVPDDQLSLAIGREGMNARLAARLTGWKIDIRPASSLNSAEEDLPEPEDEPAAEQLEAVSEEIETAAETGTEEIETESDHEEFVPD